MRVPVTLASLLDDPRRALTAPLAATAALATTSAPQLLAVFGGTAVTGGTLSGHARIDGTLAAPRVWATLDGEGLAVPRAGGTPVETIRSPRRDRDLGRHDGDARARRHR